ALQRSRDARGNADGLVEVFCLDEVEAAELLTGLGEGAVGLQGLALSDPDRGRGRRGLERLAAQHVAALLDLARELHVAGVHFSVLLGAPGLHLGFARVDEKDVLHGVVFLRARGWARFLANRTVKRGIDRAPVDFRRLRPGFVSKTPWS